MSEPSLRGCRRQAKCLGNLLVGHAFGSHLFSSVKFFFGTFRTTMIATHAMCARKRVVVHGMYRESVLCVNVKCANDVVFRMVFGRRTIFLAVKSSSSASWEKAKSTAKAQDKTVRGGRRHFKGPFPASQLEKCAPPLHGRNLPAQIIDTTFRRSVLSTAI